MNPSPSPASLSVEELKAYALSLGFIGCGVADLSLPRTAMWSTAGSLPDTGGSCVISTGKRRSGKTHGA
jgi:hypothetical protein